MARKINTEKTKKKSKLKIFMIIFFIILILAVVGFLIYKIFFAGDGSKLSKVSVNELDNLGDYGYVLTDRDSKFYKEEFEKLKKIVNVDEVDTKQYAIQVARMFTIDLYTMSTKVNKYDVGGIEYIHVNGKDMFEQKVIDTLYSQLLDDTYGDRKQVLPEVNSLTEVSVEEMKYSVLGNEQSCYLAKFNIGYVNDLKYDSSISLVVCQESDTLRWGVVDFQPGLSPSYE